MLQRCFWSVSLNHWVCQGFWDVSLLNLHFWRVGSVTFGHVWTNFIMFYFVFVSSAILWNGTWGIASLAD